MIGCYGGACLCKFFPRDKLFKFIWQNIFYTMSFLNEIDVILINRYIRSMTNHNICLFVEYHSYNWLKI